MTIQTLKSETARLHWRRIIDAARAGQDTVIEHYQTPTAAVIPYEDFLALQEELDDLRAGRRAQVALAAWENDPALGREWAEVKAELEAAK